MVVWVGYGTDADPANWTAWTPAVWTMENGNNDVFEAAIMSMEAGTYSVAGAINGNWAWGNPNYMWSYADMDWTDPAFVIDDAAILNVLDGFHLFMPTIFK
jgi:hypothetical protein